MEVELEKEKRPSVKFSQDKFYPAPSSFTPSTSCLFASFFSFLPSTSFFINFSFSSLFSPLLRETFSLSLGKKTLHSFQFPSIPFQSSLHSLFPASKKKKGTISSCDRLGPVDTVFFIFLAFISFPPSPSSQFFVREISSLRCPAFCCAEFQHLSFSRSRSIVSGSWGASRFFCRVCDAAGLSNLLFVCLFLKFLR